MAIRVRRRRESEAKVAASDWSRDFRTLWAGETVSLIGSEATLLALPLTAVLLFHATPAEMGLLSAAGFVPFLLVTLPAGVWVDRRRRRPLLIVSDLGRAALLGPIPLLAAHGWLRLWHLIGVALLSGTLAVLFEVGYQSYLPTLVPHDHLQPANARLLASESLAQVGGPGIAGLLAQTLGAPATLALDALSFLASAFGLSLISTPEPVPLVDKDSPDIWKEIAEGFRLTVTNRFLRGIGGEAATYNLFWSGIQALLVLYAVRDLRIGPGSLGLALALGSAGALLGAMVTGRLGQRLGVGVTMTGMAVIADVPPVFIPLLPAHVAATVPLLTLVFVVRGVGVTGCNVHAFSLRQAITPAALQGRMNATYRLLTYGVVPIGALLGGIAGGALGLRATVLLAGLGLATTWLWLLVSPIRGLWDLP